MGVVNKINGENGENVSLWLFYSCHHSADILLPADYIIVIVLIIYSSNFFKFLVDLGEYIASRTAINSSFFVIYSNFLPADL